MMRRLPQLPIVAALVGMAACGPFHRGGGSPASVRFVNESTDQVDVYAVASSGSRIRIGTVNAGSTVQLRVPETAIGGDGMVSIVARVFASSRTPSTGRLQLTPGQTIEVTLPPAENTLTVLPVTRP